MKEALTKESLIEDSWIKDPNLAPGGHQKIDWVWHNMPVLNSIQSRLAEEKPFVGLQALICLHLEAKTACLGLTLKAGGAEVTMTASNPLSTQDDVCAAMVERGLRVYARHGAGSEEYHRCHRLSVQSKPNLLVDDGGDLTALLHSEYPELLAGLYGGCEETTTGIQRLKAMEKAGALKIPMMAVNDADMKFLFDNRYGTGQSVWDAVMNATNLVVAGKVVVVAGYGWCGKGVSMRAKGLGARVVVTEVDPIKAVEAWMDGFQVLTMAEAAPLGDYFITVTGNRDVICGPHFDKMKDGALLANAGHFDVEISKPDLFSLCGAPRTVKPGIEEYRTPDGRRLLLMGEGRLVNLACSFGHPAEVMDTSFAVQALALEYLAAQKGRLAPGVHKVPKEIDQAVARIRLASAGINIDSLSQEQKKYQESWIIE